MSRLPAVQHASRRTIVAGLVGVLAVFGTAVNSSANSSPASTSAATIVSAGAISKTPGEAGGAVFTAGALKPGTSASGSVVVENTGPVLAAFMLSRSVSAAAAAPPSGLTIVITDEGDPACSASCPPASLVYSGAIDGMEPASLGTFAPGATRRYRMVVSSPDGGTGASDGASLASVAYAVTAVP